MPITNQLVIVYNNESIRPLAEKMRSLDAEIDAALVTYNIQISAAISGNVDGDIIEDGREGDGVSRMTKSDLTNFVTQLQAYQTQLNLAGVADVISKPTVRVLSTT